MCLTHHPTSTEASLHPSVFPQRRAQLLRPGPGLDTEAAGPAPVAAWSLGLRVPPPTCSQRSVHWPTVGGETFQKRASNLVASSRISLAALTPVRTLLGGACVGE